MTTVVQPISPTSNTPQGTQSQSLADILKTLTVPSTGETAATAAYAANQQATQQRQQAMPQFLRDFTTQAKSELGTDAATQRYGDLSKEYEMFLHDMGLSQKYIDPRMTQSPTGQPGDVTLNPMATKDWFTPDKFKGFTTPGATLGVEKTMSSAFGDTADALYKNILTAYKDISSRKATTREDYLAGIEAQKTLSDTLEKLYKSETEAKKSVTPSPSDTLSAIEKGYVWDSKNLKWIPSDVEGTGSANVGAISSTGYNEAAIANLPETEKNIIKMIADYRYPMPTSSILLKNAYWQNILKKVNLYDPSFDVTKYPSIVALRKDFSSGKTATNIKSLNTAVSHLKTLSDSIDALGNTDIPYLNEVKNNLADAAGQPQIKSFNTAANAVESELASVFKGMGATDTEIKQWRANMKSSDSPAQLKASINKAIELLSGRLGAINDQWLKTMGKNKDIEVLSPESKNILKKLGINPDNLDPVSPGVSGVTPASTGAEKNNSDPMGIL